MQALSTAVRASGSMVARPASRHRAAPPAARTESFTSCGSDGPTGAIWTEQDLARLADLAFSVGAALADAIQDSVAAHCPEWEFSVRVKSISTRNPAAWASLGA